MKSDHEMYQSVLSRREEYRRKKEKHIRMIKRTAAVMLGTAAVLVSGIATRMMKPPEKPTPSRSGIISETETASAETTVAPTTAGTAASTTSTAAQTTTTTAAAATSSARRTVTTVRTTASVAPTTLSTTSAVTASETGTTTAAQTTNKSTTTYVQVTTTPNGGDTPVITTVIEVITPCITTTASQDNAVYERMIAQNFKNISLGGKEYNRDTTVISAEYADELIGELTLEPTVYTDELPSQITARVYSVKDIDPDKLVAVLCEGSKKYRLYKCAEYSAAELAEYISYVKENYVT